MKQILLTVFLNWEQFQHNSEEISASEEILVEYHKYFRLFGFFLPAAQRHGQVVLKGMEEENRGVE